MNSPLKVIAFLSGRGSNFKNLVTEQRRHRSPAYEITGVFSDKPGAPGLYYAKEAGIPVHAFFRSDFDSLESFKKHIFEAADAFGADLGALCGYMQIVPKWFIERWQDRIINIHPSLLPKFPGLDTHTQAITAKERFHGCTVHVVDTGVDTGPIVAQIKVPVAPEDTSDSLATRVLEKEHSLYPWVLTKIAEKNITIKQGKVAFSASATQEAKNLGIDLPS